MAQFHDLRLAVSRGCGGPCLTWIGSDPNWIGNVNNSSTGGGLRAFAGLDNGVEICQISYRINGRKVAKMTLTSHLTELSEKHRLLERKLEEALTHPSVDSLEISTLKREKLKLKDEIAKLRQDRRQH